MKTTIKTTAILLFISCSTLSASAQFSKRNARDFINRTSYIIGEAYDVVYYYGYYSSGYLSKSVNHQNYAKFLYNIGNYRYAIYHSDLARTYALRVIYNSNNYWDNYYRPYYYSNQHYYSNQRPPYGNNNRPPQSQPQGNRNQNVQYGHRTSTSGGVTSTGGNNRISKYATSSAGDDLKAVDFDTWDRNYYSTEERSLLKGGSIPSEKELESAVTNNNNIRRVSSDKDVINNGIKDFSSDINTFKKSHATEAKNMEISRPSDFGTTPEVTRSTANTVKPTSNTPTTRPVQAQPVEAKPVESPVQSQPTQTRSTETRPTQTRPVQTQPEAKPTETRPVQNQSTKPRSTETRPVQTAPTESRPAQTRPVQTTTPVQSSSSSVNTQPNRSTSSQETKTNQGTTQKGSSTTTDQNTGTRNRR